MRSRGPASTAALRTSSRSAHRTVDPLYLRRRIWRGAYGSSRTAPSIRFRPVPRRPCATSVPARPQDSGLPKWSMRVCGRRHVPHATPNFFPTVERHQRASLGVRSRTLAQTSGSVRVNQTDAPTTSRTLVQDAPPYSRPVGSSSGYGNAVRRRRRIAERSSRLPASSVVRMMSHRRSSSTPRRIARPASSRTPWVPPREGLHAPANPGLVK